MIYVGIDPGASGAVAFLPEQGEPWFIKNKDNKNIYHIIGVSGESLTTSVSTFIVGMVNIAIT